MVNITELEQKINLNKILIISTSYNYACREFKIIFSLMLYSLFSYF